MVVESKSKPKAERSEAQRQQARINGARSRGPKTDEGKAVSRQNSTRHGFRAEKLVAPEDVPRVESLTNALIDDLPRSARTIDGILASNIATAVVVIEKISAARVASVARHKRKIRQNHDRPFVDSGKKAIDELMAGNTRESFELQRQHPHGCRAIAEVWEGIQARLSQLEPGQPVPDELWREVLGNVVTLEPHYQMMMRPQYEAGAEDGSIAPAILIEHCDSYVRHFRAKVERLTKDHKRSLRDKLTIAEADLGVVGQLRERYLGMARSSIARHAQQMDMETHRQWRRDKDGPPAPNEPEDSAQDIDESSVTEITPVVDETAVEVCRPEETVTPTAAVEPEAVAPNEPEKSTQAVAEPEVEKPRVAAEYVPRTPGEAKILAELRALTESCRPSWLKEGEEPADEPEPPVHDGSSRAWRGEPVLAPNEPDDSIEPRQLNQFRKRRKGDRRRR